MSDTRTPNSEYVNQRFEQLKLALSRQQLPTSTGTTREASVYEFMYMGDDGGFSEFKHSGTRNYVRLDKNGNLVVPKSRTPFLRGEFDDL